MTEVFQGLVPRLRNPLYTRVLQHVDLGCLRTLRAHAGFIADALILVQRIASALNIREMDEEVFAAALGHDEAKAFLRVEPLYDAGFHIISFRFEERRLDRGAHAAKPTASDLSIRSWQWAGVGIAGTDSLRTRRRYEGEPANAARAQPVNSGGVVAIS